ncbi:hypothetical protein [Halalkalibacter akibai]|uniref:Uncharacterized protein n=1 Tax=Halalkalibacter akibai (strain ATCC 43226 / DSM 21942 / CIP 109018 / JCM 9157 / 1139) TaxID=1236973 RepID=W4QXX2_HALA3|nr:hypothetical protein [Halalkalibacter akibai]GAE36965.1 hypothetical protein JCM9157_4203 [Halalkalibacter akibai JCM 9157]
MDKKKKTFDMPTQANTGGQFGVRTELDPHHPANTVDRYPGDSVNEHKDLERANEYIANDEIKQINENT